MNLQEAIRRAIEIEKNMTPLERAVSRLHQRESWVVGEFMMTYTAIEREEAHNRFVSACPEWLIYEEMVRLQALTKRYAVSLAEVLAAPDHETAQRIAKVALENKSQ